jgi:predicted metal-dependent phosphoesterase TrpH
MISWQRLSEMRIVIDPHIHTNSSPDSSITPNQLLDGMLATGINAIAVTDHDTMEGYKRLKHNYAFREFLIIPGIEVTTDMGDIIVLGLEDPPISKDANLLIDRAHEAGGLIVAPHPFDGSRVSLGGRCGTLRVDLIEIANGKCLGDSNRQAKEFSSLLGLPGIGGSDAHEKGQIGSVFNLLECERSLDSVLEGLRRGAKIIAKQRGNRY